MTEALHIVCPHCDAINRIPQARLEHKPNCGQCHAPLFSAQSVELTGASFHKYVQRNEIPLLVDFWAPWCGPCKVMAPHFAEAAGLLEPRVRLAKVNTEVEQGLANEFAIRSIPTLALFRGGREVARQSGSIGSSDIVRWVQSRI
jgi:thioredoxin 2